MQNRRAFVKFTAASIAAASLSTSARAASTVKVGTILAGTTMAAQLLTKHLKDSDVQVEVINFAGLTQLIQALATEDIQMGYGGVNGAIAMASRGVPLSLMANACEGGWRLVGRSDIKTVEDLRGKKIAVQTGNMCHVILVWKLKELGIEDTELVFMFNGEMPVPMQRGQVDAIFSIEPYPTFTVANGWATEIWRGYDTPLGRVSLGLLGSTRFADKNPRVAREVVQAHRLATAELAGNTAAASEFTAKVLNMNPSIVDESMKNLFFTTEHGEDFQAKVRALGSMMVEAELAERVPDWDAFFRLDQMA